MHQAALEGLVVGLFGGEGGEFVINDSKDRGDFWLFGERGERKIKLPQYLKPDAFDS